MILFRYKTYSAAVVLNSETAVRVFYNGDETTATHYGWDDEGELITVGTLNKKHNADGDYFEVANIPAHELADVFVLKIGTETIMISPISYGYLVKTKSSDETLKTLCCAFYDYAKAAEAYHNI